MSSSSLSLVPAAGFDRPGVVQLIAMLTAAAGVQDPMSRSESALLVLTDAAPPATTVVLIGLPRAWLLP